MLKFFFFLDIVSWLERFFICITTYLYTITLFHKHISYGIWVPGGIAVVILKDVVGKFYFIWWFHEKNKNFYVKSTNFTLFSSLACSNLMYYTHLHIMRWLINFPKEKKNNNKMFLRKIFFLLFNYHKKKHKTFI